MRGNTDSATSSETVELLNQIVLFESNILSAESDFNEILRLNEVMEVR